MIPNLSSGDREVALFEAISDRAKPVRRPSLGVLVPVVLMGNAAMAIVAWYAVKFALKLL
jgi:hypothetical protein